MKKKRRFLFIFNNIYYISHNGKCFAFLYVKTDMFKSNEMLLINIHNN